MCVTTRYPKATLAVSCLDSQPSRNGGKYGYYSCPNCKGSRYRKEVLENRFSHELQTLSLEKECLNAVSLAIDANMEVNRKWVKAETSRVSGRIASLQQQRGVLMEKCLKGVIPDDTAKEWFAKVSVEEEELECRLALTVGSVLDTPDILKRGLVVLADLGSVWQKSNLTIWQQLQGFIFPQGLTA